METMRFTPASDVWSFGILVIELMTNGESPYHGMSNPDVMKLTLSGGRHPKPPLCTAKLYHLLLQCWDAEAVKRPTFMQLGNAFKEMYTVSSKGADANAALVEAHMKERHQRGVGQNVYAGFGADDPEAVRGGGTNIKMNPIFDGGAEGVNGAGDLHEEPDAAAASMYDNTDAN
jgi:serine/threonine protein kinase